MRGASSGVGWIRSADAAGIRLAFGAPAWCVALAGVTWLAFTPAAMVAQELPRLHITALGLHADQRVVRPGQSFHVTVHVHVREKRQRLDELVLPALTNAVDLGDERKRVPAADGTDFYETLTVAANTVGTASFSPAYIDAIDPATGRGMRYSSQPLTVRVALGTTVRDADPGALRRLLRNTVLTIAGAGIALALAIVLIVRGRRRPRAVPVPAPPLPARRAGPPADELRAALAVYRSRSDDASLDALRNVLFTRAGAGPGATFADALRALGSRDPQLARVMAVAERARFGPVHERASAARDLLVLLDAYVPQREPVA